MKRLFTSVLSFLMAFSLWAETPQTISYQAVVRNNQGRLLRETNVGVRISILQESENGTTVYTETRTVKTNVNGLMTFAIGDANGITSDTLANIAWADNSYFLRCDIDLDGGENYTLSSTSQMNSVPYALYAKNIAPEALPTWAQSEDKPVYNYSEIQDAPEVPTKVSELENDANYITLEDVKQVVAPTKMSQMENDADYAKKSDIPSLEGYVSTEYASIAFQPKGNYITEAEVSSTYQPIGNYLTEHQSLADYAKKSDIPTVPTNVSSFTNDAGYLTEHQSLADYAKKSELPKADSLLSKAEASTTYQPKGNYLTEHQSLADYAKKSEIPSVPTNVSSFTNDAGYLTEHQSLADYAKKSELPSTAGLLSETKAAETYQPKGNYLTEHQSLADYAKKSEIPSVPTKVSSFTNDAGYLTEHQSLEDYAKKSDIPTVPTKVSSFTNDAGYLTEHQSLADYAKKSELPSTEGLLSETKAAETYQPKGNYLTEHQSLAAYAKKTDIPAVPTKVSSFTNDAGYITAADIPTVQVPSLADYAKKSDLPKTDSLLSKAEASTTYQPKGNYLTEHQSLADYAKKTDIPTVPTKVSSFTNDAGYLTEHQSLADYAKKSDLPKKDSLLSKAEASTTYQPKGNYLTEHQSLAAYAKKTDIPTVPTNVSSFTNDAGYLTEHQSLADYAKKSELPKSDSLLSKAEASTTYQPKGNYLTEHQSLADYAKKTDIPTVPTKVSSFTNDAGYLTEHQSLEAYAKKTDIPTVPTKVSSFTNDAGYLTEHQSLADYAKKTDIPSVPTKVSSFTNDAGYLTEHQSLADYAKKTDIPTMPTKVSSFTNDAGYLTEHQSLADYAKKTDLPTVPTKVSAFENDATYIKKADFDAIIADYNTLLDQYRNELASLKREFSGVTPNNPFNEGSGQFNGHEYVDLGLPSGTKWATMNLGATKPEAYGNYYAWGEVKTKSNYSSSTSTTYDKSMSELLESEVIYAKGSLTATYDAVTQEWGNLWRMPTIAEFTELFENCTWTWTTINSVKGYKVSSRKPGNNNWIFLPAAGYKDGTSSKEVGTSARYWSSTTYNNKEVSNYLAFGQESKTTVTQYRYHGYTVRPVVGERKDLKVYNVSFYGPDGTLIESQKVEEGKTASVVVAPVKEGYDFAGWSDSSFINVKKDVDVHAVYVEINNITSPENGVLNGYEYVDLGLPSGLKWATMNVGATKPEGSGDKYAWGEIATKTEYTSSNSTTYNKSVSTLKTNKVIDANGVLTKSNDVASQKWGDKWRMPTVAEYNELVEYCTWTWTKLNGVSGYKVASQKPGNQNWIFIPSYHYWSSTIYDGTSSAYASFNSTTSKGTGYQNRYDGYSVRPVCGVKTYSVSFYDQNGNVIESHKVEAGKSAVAPAAPVVDGYEFTGWDKTFTNVQSDLIVTAQYKKKSESPESVIIDGHEYVDLGLPSKILWATENAGPDNGFSGVTLTPASPWGYSALKSNFVELFQYCTVESYNDGIKVIGSNGNSIFLPAGSYWASTGISTEANKNLCTVLSIPSMNFSTISTIYEGYKRYYRPIAGRK